VFDNTELSGRLLDFATNCIGIVPRFEHTLAGKHIALQLIRSATSSGANYEEACGAESRADFIHKLQIVLKELRESLYWLKLAKRVQASLRNDLQPLLNESQELTKIIAKSIVTAKKGKKKG
jgi:four helix bundle protein